MRSCQVGESVDTAHIYWTERHQIPANRNGHKTARTVKPTRPRLGSTGSEDDLHFWGLQTGDFVVAASAFIPKF